MRRFLVLLAGLLTASCQTPEVSFNVPSNRSYSFEADTVRQRLIMALKSEGLSISESDFANGQLAATLIDYQPRGWAACRARRVIDRQDDKSRRGRGRPVDRALRLAVQIDDIGEMTKVKMRAAFSERQTNPFKNLPFRVACRSTGDLERALFAAIDRA